jgi:hypothetical protein
MKVRTKKSNIDLSVIEEDVNGNVEVYEVTEVLPDVCGTMLHYVRDGNVYHCAMSPGYVVKRLQGHPVVCKKSISSESIPFMGTVPVCPGESYELLLRKHIFEDTVKGLKPAINWKVLIIAFVIFVMFIVAGVVGFAMFKNSGGSEATEQTPPATIQEF